jgi:hypothetical protein
MKQQQNNNNTTTPVTLYLHDEQCYVTIIPKCIRKIKRFSIEGRNVAKYSNKLYVSCYAIETKEEIFYSIKTISHAIDEFFGIKQGQSIYLTF